MQTPAADFLLFPVIPTESSDMFSIDSSSQQMLYQSDQLAAVDNISAMNPYSYHLLDSNYPLLSQNIHASRSMKPFNHRSTLYPESTTDMSRGMYFADTPPAAQAPQLLERMPTPFSASNASITSASTSANGSPYSESWIDANTGVGLHPSVVNDMFPTEFTSAEADLDPEFAIPEKFGGSCVDPQLINHQETQIPPTTYSEQSSITDTTGIMSSNQVPSPLSMSQSFATPIPPSHHRFPTTSPYLGSMQVPSGQGFDHTLPGSTMHSPHSQNSPSMSQTDVDEDGRERGRCPFPDCSKIVKDLKAHMLTHQSERPEKCPIVTCEYHLKGFSRKYDRNRHTLIHYKGTMVCGFCPGSGSAAEKSFNRADVFKRHLTSVHGVELTPPNCRKRTPAASSAGLSSYSPDATGKCSTCSKTFRNAQDFYEHLDDCVLRVVQQEQPSEAINQQRLAEVASDEEVKKTMEKHMLVDNADNSSPSSHSEDNDEEEISRGSPPASRGRSNKKKGKSSSSNNSVLRAGPGNNGITKPRTPVTRRRGNRNNYPQSWGSPRDQMTTKRRVLCVYDGKNQLWKDEMMLDNNSELRIPLFGGAGDGTHRDYVTDLDVATMNRAIGVHSATEEERGPWLSGPPNRLIGQPAMPLPELPHTQFKEEVDIDDLMLNV